MYTNDNEISNEFFDNSYDNDDFSNNAGQYSDKSNVEDLKDEEFNFLEIKSESSDDFKLKPKDYQNLYYAKNYVDMKHEQEKELKKMKRKKILIQQKLNQKLKSKSFKKFEEQFLML